MTPGLGCLTGSTARPTLTRPTQRKHTHGSHAGPKANRSSAKSEGVRRPAAPRRGQRKSQAISASTETPGTNGQRLARSGPALVRPCLALPGWTRCASIRGAPAGSHPTGRRQRHTWPGKHSERRRPHREAQRGSQHRDDGGRTGPTRNELAVRRVSR